jgi:TRAP-type C4-dicarboxylate transport system permease small subunit
MKNPLDSITGTIVAGLVLTIILYVFARQFLGVGT